MRKASGNDEARDAHYQMEHSTALKNSKRNLVEFQQSFCNFYQPRFSPRRSTVRSRTSARRTRFSRRSSSASRRPVETREAPSARLSSGMLARLLTSAKF